MMKELTKLSTVAGLQMKAKNTKVMANSAEMEIKLNGETLEFVPECTYLGQLISFRNNTGKYIKNRISVAWNMFKSLLFILVQKFQKLQIKKDILESCVFPVLLYGAQK